MLLLHRKEDRLARVRVEKRIAVAQHVLQIDLRCPRQGRGLALREAVIQLQRPIHRAKADIQIPRADIQLLRSVQRLTLRDKAELRVL